MKPTTTQTPTSGAFVTAASPCWIVTVDVLATIYADAGKTPSAIRADIFKAEDRLNSRGERIPGNGLAAHGAVIRRGRKVLLDVHRYGQWLAGRSPAEACTAITTTQILGTWRGRRKGSPQEGGKHDTRL